MGVKVGDYFEGLDCCNELIRGSISKILENVVIVECEVKYHVVKKSEFKNQGRIIPDYVRRKEFNNMGL